MKKTQILIVEDERIVALDIQNSLEKKGYEVPEIVSNGVEAIERAGAIRPDIVLMDIKLKGEMDGIEAARIIHERFNIPVMYITAYSDEKTLGRADSTNPIGYIFKPFREGDLQSSIQSALEKHRGDIAVI